MIDCSVNCLRKNPNFYSTCSDIENIKLSVFVDLFAQNIIKMYRNNVCVVFCSYISHGTTKLSGKRFVENVCPRCLTCFILIVSMCDKYAVN